MNPITKNLTRRDVIGHASDEFLHFLVWYDTVIGKVLLVVDACEILSKLTPEEQEALWARYCLEKEER